jgi:hypothetical protein
MLSPLYSQPFSPPGQSPRRRRLLQALLTISSMLRDDAYTHATFRKSQSHTVRRLNIFGVGL